MAHSFTEFRCCLDENFDFRLKIEPVWKLPKRSLATGKSLNRQTPKPALQSFARCLDRTRPNWLKIGTSFPFYAAAGALTAMKEHGLTVRVMRASSCSFAISKS